VRGKEGGASLKGRKGEKREEEKRTRELLIDRLTLLTAGVLGLRRRQLPGLH